MVSTPNTKQMQEPSAQDIMKRLRNQVKLAFSDGEEMALKVVDVYEKQIVAAANQINGSALEITRLQDILKKRKIDFSPPPPPKEPKEPNRAEKRRAAKAAKKAAKKSKTSK